jgi:arylsulfatase A-like enzyme
MAYMAEPWKVFLFFINREPGEWFMLLLRTLFFQIALLSPIMFSGCGEKPRPCIVLIMVDTLRADHLECYGSESKSSPFISTLAEEGTLFTQVVAASPWTGPSVASILTGNYPDEVGIHDLRDPLHPSSSTLSEILRKEGYATGAVVSNSMAGPVYGFDKGYDAFFFERYKGKEGEVAPEQVDRPVFTADRVTEKAIETLKRMKKPFFLYVHYTDPHDPYLPPPPWRDQILGDRNPLKEDLLIESRFTETALSSDEVETIRSYYEAEIAFIDHEIGRLVGSLSPATLVVFTGDHGEEFQEHGGFLHGHTLYQELLHVPLIIKGPGIPTRKTVTDLVSHVDIVPTLLDLLGLTAKEDLSGKSLSPFFQDGPVEQESRTLFSMLETRDKRRISARRGPWKLILAPEERTLWLYNLDRDPRERNNIALENNQLVSSIIDSIKARKSRIIPALKRRNPELDKEREEELRAIGYIK